MKCAQGLRILASACAASKACEIVSAPTLSVERELAVVGQPGALELRQRRRDRLAAGDARKDLPERKNVQQGVVEAAAGHGARYVSGVADERHVPCNEPRRHILGDWCPEATACAQTHLHGALPRIRPAPSSRSRSNSTTSAPSAANASAAQRPLREPPTTVARSDDMLPPCDQAPGVRLLACRATETIDRSG
jgi:hypothetical protein